MTEINSNLNATEINFAYTAMESVACPVVLTSDGIRDYLSVDRMEDIIGEYGLTEAAWGEMISMARRQGSCDDASMVIDVFR